MLDVGAHMGSLMRALRDSGWGVEGVEPAAVLCQLGQEHYRLFIRTGFYSREAYAGEAFDLIIFDNVLEHLEEPVRRLRDAHYHLRPGGSILIIIPILESIQPNQIGGWHTFIPSMGVMKAILESCGFSVNHFRLDGQGGGDGRRLRCLASKRSTAQPLPSPISARKSYAEVWARLFTMVMRYKFRLNFG